MLTIEEQVDYPFLRLPYEVISKQYKINRKLIEQEFAQILSHLVRVDSETKANVLISKLNELKSKLNDNYQQLKEYLQHLSQRVKIGQCTHEQRLQRGIVDYLMREGYVKTANQLIQSYQIENFTFLEKELIIEANQILQDLKNHQVQSVLSWCQKNHNKLKKCGSQLENQCLFQEFITKLINSTQMEALMYLRQNSKRMEQETIQKAMGCLILCKNVEKYPIYQHYFNPEQWDLLQLNFKKKLYEVYGMLPESSLSSAIKCGISTLKTLYCSEKNYKNTSKCPICSNAIQKLSKELLMTQKLGSTWICRISGELMDENNPPMMLPNQQVYSQKSLSQMSERLNGMVHCPVSKSEFKFSDCVRVYLT